MEVENIQSVSTTSSLLNNPSMNNYSRPEVIFRVSAVAVDMTLAGVVAYDEGDAFGMRFIKIRKPTTKMGTISM